MPDSSSESKKIQKRKSSLIGKKVSVTLNLPEQEFAGTLCEDNDAFVEVEMGDVMDPRGPKAMIYHVRIYVKHIRYIREVINR